jgi:hypothetical protein
MMKQMHRNLRFGLLALVPLIGFGVIAWLNATHPRKTIVGKWRLVGLDHTIEFSSDGTYVSMHKTRMETRVYYLGPYGKSRMRHIRSWGRYWFPDRYTLRMESTGLQVDGGPTTHQTPDGAIQRSHNPIRIRIDGNEARIASTSGSDRIPVSQARVWKRIK